ncbi:MAG TPA: 5-formyltetrahydrofolate cyclo-ligase [Bacillota bacterium]|nr:5-formyltetrahydrofolate cyclo-ligase [Bacillota bacterium]
MKVNKNELRQFALSMLKKMPSTKKKHIETKQQSHLFHTRIWERAKTIGITIAKEIEWDTAPIIEKGWQDRKTIAVPKCVPEKRRLDFYRLRTYDQLEISYYNLLEPKPDRSKYIEKDSIDLLIVPGVLFDKRGYRIGFGGGYYDRFLIDFPNQTVSLTSSKLLVDTLPAESFDIPVDHIITENGLLSEVSSE